MSTGGSRRPADRRSVALARRYAAVPVLVALTLVAATSCQLPVGVIFGYGLGLDRPESITVGPDGAFWITNLGNDTISRMTTDGSMITWDDPSIRDPMDITTGSDGALWFTNRAANTIGRITTAGAVSSFADPGISGPFGITAGPDGALWFTNNTSSTIGRITTAGAVTTFPAAASKPRGITAGPDGALWYVNETAATIGRITTGGTSVGYGGGGLISGGFGITTGPDGNLWATGADQIAKVTPAGVVTTYTHGSVSGPRHIVTGADGALYYTNELNATIGRITTSGTISYLRDLTQTYHPRGLVAGPDGALWFTEPMDQNRTGGYTGHHAVGRVTTAGSFSLFLGPAVDAPAGVAAGGSNDLWFTSRASARIGHADHDGNITSFPSPADEPYGIAYGPDGNVWYTDCDDLFLSCRGTIYRMAPDGTTTPFTDPSIASARSIVVGPDGALWFTDTSGDHIGRITTAGAVTWWAGAGIVDPWSITSGPDGALWFTNKGDKTVGRITTAGAVTTFSDPGLTGFGSDLHGIVTGPDGNLWLTGGPGVFRVTTGGGFTPHAVPGGASSIASGPDGNLWFTSTGTDQIGRLTTGGTLTLYSSSVPRGVHGPTDIVAGPDQNMWFSNTMLLTNPTGGTIGAIGTTP